MDVVCRFGLSLRTSHQAAFQKVVDADVTHRTTEDRAHLRKLARIVFDALVVHEKRCLICGMGRDA